jgi:hypothetical protein
MTLYRKAVYNACKSMATRKTTKLNTRQLKFIQNKLIGKSNAQAARDAGYSESVANVAGNKIGNHPAVQAKLQQLMNRAGLTDERLSQAIQGPDGERLAQIERLDPDIRQPIQRLIYYLALGETSQAMLSLWLLKKRLEKIRRRGAMIEELRQKLVNRQ